MNSKACGKQLQIPTPCNSSCSCGLREKKQPSEQSRCCDRRHTNRHPLPPFPFLQRQQRLVPPHAPCPSSSCSSCPPPPRRHHPPSPRPRPCKRDPSRTTPTAPRRRRHCGNRPPRPPGRKSAAGTWQRKLCRTGQGGSRGGEEPDKIVRAGSC